MKTAALLTTLVALVLSKDLYSIQQDKTLASQFADCYDYTSLGGEKLHVVSNLDSLTKYNFDNRISSCCFTGIWILYADNNYNTANTASANWWQFGNNYCLNVPTAFDNVASSLRYVGVPDNAGTSTINLYNNNYFIGTEEWSYTDKPQMTFDNQAKSVIITGCQAWTVYDGFNYSGQCKCLWPSDTNNCYPGFYTTESSLGNMARTISSARKGCYCSNSAVPDNQGMKLENGGASGYFAPRNV